MMINSDKLLIIIAGPTAVGKTKLSIEIAKTLETEIVSADSRQFYKELKIGTAPPSDEELKAVPHHFIQHLSIQDYYNVSRYEIDAIENLKFLFSKHNQVILTGGSGMYINAIIHGIDDLPDPDISLREHLKDTYVKEGIQTLRKKLEILDPEYYSQVDQKNPARLIRAIEVCETTGMKYSDLRKYKKKQREFKYLFIGLNRERNDLIRLINARTDDMIKKGLIEEARELYPFRNLNALNTVGYRELFDFFDEKISLEQSIENIKTNTRRYAKRQLTWFRKIQEIQWFYADDQEKIISYLKNNISHA